MKELKVVLMEEGDDSGRQDFLVRSRVELCRVEMQTCFAKARHSPSAILMTECSVHKKN